MSNDEYTMTWNSEGAYVDYSDGGYFDDDGTEYSDRGVSESEYLPVTNSDSDDEASEWKQTLTEFVANRSGQHLVGSRETPLVAPNLLDDDKEGQPQVRPTVNSHLRPRTDGHREKPLVPPAWKF